ncbi:MAG: hypothetical protein ACFFD4_36560, partial [Candidatus Odinarchaeota archaeon]
MDGNQLSSDKERMDHFITAFAGLFSHERANSLITRSFTGCHEGQHKTDCMVSVLQKALSSPDIFYSKVRALINLHSNVIKEKPALLTALNDELRLLGLYYDTAKMKLAGTEHFEPYIQISKYISIDENYLPDLFYENLLQEINWCYATRSYSASKVMLRKCFENLIVDILRKKYQQDKLMVGLYYKNGKFLTFFRLIENFRSHQKEFTQYSSKIDDKLFDFLDSIRHSGNEG